MGKLYEGVVLGPGEGDVPPPTEPPPTFGSGDSFTVQQESYTQTQVSRTKVTRTTVTGLRKLRTHNFMEVYNSEHVLEWVKKGLLPKKGLIFLGGRSGVGKTILAIQFGVDIVLNRPTMTWFPGDDLEQQKILMLSLEMPQDELRERIRAMYPQLTEAEQKMLAENFIIYDDFDPVHMYNDLHVVELIEAIKELNVSGVILDSASVSFGSSLKDDKEVNKSLRNMYEIRQKAGVWFTVVAHTRKIPAGAVEDPDIITPDDLFGHSGVAQHASSILIMVENPKRATEGGKSLDLVYAKTRFSSEEKRSVGLKLNFEPLQFERPAFALPGRTQSTKREDKKRSSLTFDAAVAGVNFSNFAQPRKPSDGEESNDS